MSEGGSFHADYPDRRARGLEPGEVVQVKFGPLASATGVVQRIVDDQRCVIAIDGVDEAVWFIVYAAWLERADSAAR